ITLVVVFVSILFMGGVVEKLFREFSITLAATMLISLAVSLSLTPSLCARILRPQPPVDPDAPPQASIFDDIKTAHATSLNGAVRLSLLVILLRGTVIGVNVCLYVAGPKIMLPEQDTGQLTGWIRGDDGFSFRIMQ